MSGRGAAVLIARWLGVPVPSAVRPRWDDVDLGRVDGRRVSGRLWLPRRPAPPVLLAAGITPEGVGDPRLMRLAGALARSPRSVFAPELGLARRRLEPGDVGRIAGAIRALHAHPATLGPVTVVGFSFGGSFALVAAADERVAPLVGRVASFGAYAHLENLIRDVRIEDRGLLREHLDAATGREGDGALTPDERRAIEAVLVEGSPVSSLPDGLRARFDALSPIVVAHRVRAPVALAHAEADPVIGVDEMRRLADAIPRARTTTLRGFTHVDFRPTPRRVLSAARDLVELWRFARFVLAGAGDAVAAPR